MVTAVRNLLWQVVIEETQLPFYMYLGKDMLHWNMIYIYIPLYPLHIKFRGWIAIIIFKYHLPTYIRQQFKPFKNMSSYSHNVFIRHSHSLFHNLRSRSAFRGVEKWCLNTPRVLWYQALKIYSYQPISSTLLELQLCRYLQWLKLGINSHNWSNTEIG